MKTVAIKVEDDLHAQLLLVAQLEGTTLTDVIRQAVEQYVEGLKTGDGLASKAQALLDEIERDVATRREAVRSLLGQQKPEAAPSPKPSRRTPAAPKSS
jgi:predicted transcriptional regulator